MGAATFKHRNVIIQAGASVEEPLRQFRKNLFFNHAGIELNNDPGERSWKLLITSAIALTQRISHSWNRLVNRPGNKRVYGHTMAGSAPPTLKQCDGRRLI